MLFVDPNLAIVVHRPMVANSGLVISVGVEVLIPNVKQAIVTTVGTLTCASHNAQAVLKPCVAKGLKLLVKLRVLNTSKMRLRAKMRRLLMRLKH